VRGFIYSKGAREPQKARFGRAFTAGQAAQRLQNGTSLVILDYGWREDHSLPTATATLSRSGSGAAAPTAFDSRWVPPVGGAPSRRTSTGGAATGLLSPVPEATQVLGAREPGSAPSGSQANPSGAVNQQQAARQPGEAMSSGASGWAGSQPRRCAGRQAGAHRRGEDKPRSEVNGFPPHWKKGK
jgi:hypothetical protein